MLAAMLALAVAIAVPAFAQLESGIEQETESDDVAIGFDVSKLKALATHYYDVSPF